MIPYELAQKLKDAGFPQKEFHGMYEGHGEPVLVKDMSTFVKPYPPTLSELIEACGDIEFILHCYPKNHGGDITGELWFVIERKNLMDMRRCSTPEEAVANLWLELNQS